MQRDLRAHTERAVVPEEAAVIRRIFEMVAAGLGYQRIAHRLNEERVLAPVPRRRGRPRGWAPSTIRAMLFRELYRGVIVWNRTERIIRRGGHRKRARAATDWLRLDAPALRIVPEPLWLAAHARLAGTRTAYLGARNGHAGGRPVNGTEGRYLLTGLGQCGGCGGGMFVHTRGPWHRGAPSFGCSAYHTRGPVVCPNNLEVPLLNADHAVLAAVERDLLRVEVLETSLAKALDLMRPDTARLGEQRERITKELGRLDAELERLTGAIAAGGELAALLAALQARERQRQALHAELVGLEHVTAGAGRFDLPGTLTALREQLTDWQGMLRQEGPQVRHALSALLVGRLVFTPRGKGQGRHYEFAGPGTLRKVIAGLAFPIELVPPG
jgi:hypothetical protein